MNFLYSTNTFHFECHNQLQRIIEYWIKHDWFLVESCLVTSSVTPEKRENIWHGRGWQWDWILISKVSFNDVRWFLVKIWKYFHHQKRHSNWIVLRTVLFHGFIPISGEIESDRFGQNYIEIERCEGLLSSIISSI